MIFSPVQSLASLTEFDTKERSKYLNSPVTSKVVILTVENDGYWQDSSDSMRFYSHWLILGSLTSNCLRKEDWTWKSAEIEAMWI